MDILNIINIQVKAIAITSNYLSFLIDILNIIIIHKSLGYYALEHFMNILDRGKLIKAIAMTTNSILEYSKSEAGSASSHRRCLKMQFNIRTI